MRSAGRKTPERWEAASSATRAPNRWDFKGTASTNSVDSNWSAASGWNPIQIAARAIGSCFSPAMPPRSPTGDFSEDLHLRSPIQSPSVSIHGNSKEDGRKILGIGMYGGGSGYGSSQNQSGGMKFTPAEIQRATKNFSPAFKIGQGGFGTVYKGKLDDGTLVAIKRAKKSIYDNQLGLEFQSEIQTLARVEHLSLVKFFGFLEYGDERIVVVEYVPNGTLREHLDCVHGKPLDLAARLDIAIDVAHAVTYLHMYTDHPIIHRDIKSSNILLTETLRAKVADFGFARLGATESGVSHVETQVKGTAGYLDPEYLRTYQLTEKSDVFSFGVLLVELVTGRRPIEPKRELQERVTPKWAMKKFMEGSCVQILDPNLAPSPRTNLATEKILELALQCLAPTRQSRPRMQRCAEILWNIRKDYRELLSSEPLQHQHSKDSQV
ncbi:calmodulin-binding receptor-like cytoplasmic kinase 2 [Dioscorea cayenensis subsp. rotundata]|uniref:non-specific serine/threonine protein kinase n=1 Tax=Dioscorea cayennensis subsp. rotundata TaxID=55577 RepID=A0AB40C4C9_DIOCR|nr:calmodulin-binding receptor-like cytoplasmic kinase 2 [Dioscorea cayenensis subsp. rotundata]